MNCTTVCLDSGVTCRTAVADSVGPCSRIDHTNAFPFGLLSHNKLNEHKYTIIKLD